VKAVTRELVTQRLLLRRWRSTDREPFAALNADPAVVEHLSGPMTRDESDAFIERIESHWDQHGYGLWAVEVPGQAGCIGFVGIQRLAFMPKDEIGWRLARAFWGRGYATEAARAALADGFGRLGLDEIISITVPANKRSRRVMERIGLTHDRTRDFDHPKFPPGHRLSRHVLYAMTREEWMKR
jgi:RimJ/RimL family protein N-acetyltransferase